MGADTIYFIIDLAYLFIFDTDLAYLFIFDTLIFIFKLQQLNTPIHEVMGLSPQLLSDHRRNH